MRRNRLSCLILLFVAGCASAPKSTGPRLEVDPPTTWSSASEAAATPIDTLWWTRLGDSGLDSLIEAALGYNYNLQAAAARLGAAAAQAKIAGAPLLPQLNTGFNASRRKQNFIGLPFGGTDSGVQNSESTSYGVSVDISWELDLWGRLSATQAAALADLQAADAHYLGARLSLVAQTGKAWFAAVEAGRQTELAEQTLQNYETSEAQVRERYERGVRPSLDLRLIVAEMESARDRLHQRRQLLSRSVRQLELLLGRYPSGALKPGLNLPAVVPAVPAGLPANLIARRPDLISAERSLAASHARVQAARRALYPRISLTASGGTSTDDLSNLLNGDYAVWNLIGNIVQPLFQGGRLRANVDLSKSQETADLALFAQTVLTAYAEVENGLTDVSILASRQKALEAAVEQSTAARRLSEERYASGLTDLITMLSAQRAAYAAESQLLTVKRLRLDAQINLHLALGGGFPTNSEPASTANSDTGAK